MFGQDGITTCSCTCHLCPCLFWVLLGDFCHVSESLEHLIFASEGILVFHFHSCLPRFEGDEGECPPTAMFLGDVLTEGMWTMNDLWAKVKCELGRVACCCFVVFVCVFAFAINAQECLTSLG